MNDTERITDIDRSERIEFTYQMVNGMLEKVENPHDCPNWRPQDIMAMTSYLKHEIENGGRAVGAFDEEKLVGFGVLAHKFRGEEKDQLQISLMYVSRYYRRQGIGTLIMNMLSQEAVKRDAKYLYISSTETKSAYHFYESCGIEITEVIDKELFELEPKDIHMIKKL